MPQLTPEQLLESAELAGFARVVKIRHTPDGRVAQLRFEQVIKGDFRGGLVQRQWYRLSGAVTVKLHKAMRSANGQPLNGEWSDRVDPGDRIMVHLRWDPGSGAYATVAANAIWLAPG